MPLTGDRTSPLAAQMLAWYFLLSASVLGVILVVAPHFSYSLDDPYIHLALSQTILHGHYGINPGETVSPSSSVLWPFLLVAFSETALREWVPLVWNVIFSALTCVVVGRFLGQRLEKNGMSKIESGLFAPVLVVAGNLVGLTFTGMEHSLQILLVSLCAIGVVLAYEGKRVPGYCVVAAALAPAVRYEDLAFTAAICGVLWLQRRRGHAVATFIVSLLPILLLGLFFHAHGLSFFPNSVLAKSRVVEAVPGASVARTAVTQLLSAMKVNALHYFMQRTLSHNTIALMFVGVIFLGWRGRTDGRSGILVPALLAALAMMLLGPFGWFYRYDVCLRLFLFLIALCLSIGFLPHRRWVVWSLGILVAAFYLPALLRTPSASIEIARQQYQMHRFTSQFAHENVALNDLGWVSLDVNGRFYVLDLMGLGSDETLRVAEKNKSAAWLDRVTREHDIGLVMVYREWFKEFPTQWIPLGTLRQKKQYFKRQLGEDEVLFFATTPASAERLRSELRQFRATLPAGVDFQPTVP